MVHTIELTYYLTITEFIKLLPSIRSTPNFDGHRLDLFMQEEASLFEFASGNVGIIHLKATRADQFTGIKNNSGPTSFDARSNDKRPLCA